MFYVRNSRGDWLLPVPQWYHGFPTFTNTLAMAGQFTNGQANAFLNLPRMPAGAFVEPVA